MLEEDGFKAFAIREAISEDIQGMLEVFNYYVENSFAAYLETPVGPDFFKNIYEGNEQKKDEQFPLCDRSKQQDYRHRSLETLFSLS